jgi:membrane-associated phospholipid phosphatase
MKILLLKALHDFLLVMFLIIVWVPDQQAGVLRSEEKQTDYTANNKDAPVDVRQISAVKTEDIKGNLLNVAKPAENQIRLFCEEREKAYESDSQNFLPVSCQTNGQKSGFYSTRKISSGLTALEQENSESDFLRPRPPITNSQSPDFIRQELAHERPYWRTNLFKRVLIDQKFLVTTWWPSELKRPIIATSLVFLTAEASNSSGEPAHDLTLTRYVDALVVGESSKVARVFSSLGDRETGIVLIGATYLIGLWSDNTRLARASSLSAEAALNAGIWNEILKHVSARTRPTHNGRGEFFTYNPIKGQSNSSFPSGHAMGAFAVASVFAGEYRDKRWVPWVAYGAAGMISGSRVALGSHFTSDVIVGAILGYSIGKMVIARQNGYAGERLLRLQPIFDPVDKTYGLTYSYSW